ncbi:MAG: argininosuccinate lyase [Phycisphaeraceae bacterium]|nr:argininosuccinate lyase [Phycisphaeraceae bacterium]
MSDSAAKPWEHSKDAGSGADPLAARFVCSLDDDWRLYRHDIAGSIAHAAMLRDQELISADEYQQIEDGLRAIEKEIDQHGRNWDGFKTDLEDVHMCIEAALIERAGDAGRKLHTGRSRNDQVATDLKLWLRDAGDEIDQQVLNVIDALLELAGRDGEIVMPSYTHLQRAQPIVVGGELMAWIEALDRGRRRLAVLRELDDHSPLGSGAVAGSSLPIDRDKTAEALGLGAPTGSSIDATASRDAALDFLYGLSTLAMWLSRWAEQWIIYMSSEFGFLKLGDAYTTGSSMMPQKRNPDMLELIRGRCGRAYGELTALLTICKGLTVGYNRDLQQDKGHLFAAYDSVRDSLEMAGRIIASASFDEERIGAGLDRGFADATSLAEYLVGRGVPFRTAHQWAGRLVRAAEEHGAERLTDLTVDQMNEVADGQVGEDVYDWLGPDQVVQRYRSGGNAGLTGFRRRLEAWRDRRSGS